MTGTSLVLFVRSHGYDLVRSSRNGYDVYARGKHEVRVRHSPSEADEIAVRREIERQLGIGPAKRRKQSGSARKRAAAKKREHVAQLKAERERERLIAEREAAIAKAKADRAVNDAALDGYGKNLTNREARKVASLLERNHRDERELERIIASVPDQSVRGDPMPD